MLHFMGNRWGNSGNSVRLHFSGLQNHCNSSAFPKTSLNNWKFTVHILLKPGLEMVTAAMKLKDTYSMEVKL